MKNNDKVVVKKYDVVALGALVVDMQIATDDAQLEKFGIKKGLTNLVSAETAKEIADNLAPARTPGGPGTNVTAGVALRATFIVDPEGIIRWVSVNDLSAGRNVAEVVRTLDALQSDELCPCNWQKGEKTLGAAS